MRIAQLAPPWLTVPPSGYGGIEWIVSSLADGLVRRGHDVTLYAPGGSSTAAELVSPFPKPSGTDNIGQIYPELVQALTCYVDADRFDVIHDHCSVGGAALGAFSDTPVLITLHGAFVPEVRRLFELIGNRLHFVAVSSAQRASMPDLPYVGTIANGIDVDSFPFQAEKDGYLAYVGRFTPEKGAHIALDVAHRLDLPLVMAGKTAEPHEHKYLADKILPELGPQDDYRGEVTEEEKRKIFAGARAMLFPIQWNEPFGLVMTEAMACGTPVIAWKNGAAPEVVAHGLTGFIIQSVDEMIDAVYRIDEIEPAACRAHVEGRFSADAMVDAYEQAYRHLVE